MSVWAVWLDAHGQALHQQPETHALIDAPSLEPILRRVIGAVAVEIYVTGRGKVREWPEAFVELDRV